MATIAEDQDLLRRITAALIDYYDHPVQRLGDDVPLLTQVDSTRRRAAQQDLAARLVNEALRRGISHRQISSASQLPGKLIIPLIEDEQHRSDAYAAELHHLERAVEEIRDMRIRRARWRRSNGEKKVDLADSYGVTRPTLDKWLDTDQEMTRA